MLFNSLDFAIFLPVLFGLYWFVFNRSLIRQNLLIVISSYLFYSWWDWRFLGLIFLSTITDYWVGLGLEHESSPAKRKLFLWASLIVNLGALGLFKYFNGIAKHNVGNWGDERRMESSMADIANAIINLEDHVRKNDFRREP